MIICKFQLEVELPLNHHRSLSHFEFKKKGLLLEKYKRMKMVDF